MRARSARPLPAPVPFATAQAALKTFNRPARQLILGLEDELVCDWFAGGGGMAQAIEQALGRHVDVSCNHDDDAISMHMANHPQSRHFTEDVRSVCARMASEGRPVGLFHMSPDCTHHSQAKGGQPRDRAMRALSWVGLRWAGQVRPRIITLENVKQILRWGPLIAKRDPATGRVVKVDLSVAAPGEQVPIREQFLIPDPKRAGQTWRRFVTLLRGMGYEVESRVLCAADYGVPTTRTRLFMVARRDGAPIAWPEPTHFKSPKRGQKRWRAAAECIDFSIESKSIFGRKKNLADATLRRVALGMRKFVLECPEPYIVNNMTNNVPRSVSEPVATIMAGGGHKILVAPSIVPVTHGGGERVHAPTEPLRTITTAHRGEFALSTAVLVQAGAGGATSAPPVPAVTALGGGGLCLSIASMVQTGYGERDGQAPRALDIQEPIGTVVAGGGKHALMISFLAQANDGFNLTIGRDLREPISTVTKSGSQQQLVSALLTPLDGAKATGPAVDYQLAPEHEEGALRCAAFLVKHQGGALREELLALVTVWIKGAPWAIYDICLRMLVPAELYLANGFPRGYIIDRGHDGRQFTKGTQVRLCGNAVPPGLGAAVISAQWKSRPTFRLAA